MKRTAILLTALLLLAAAESAETAGPMPGSRTNEPPPQEPSSAHMNRHVDAHVPAREGQPKSDRDEPRRRPIDDPMRGVVHTPLSPVPSATQPLRDRRY